MDTVKHSRRHSRGNRGQFGERVETVAPTVETALKLVPDSLSILNPEQHHAALAIAWMHESIRRAYGPQAARASNLEPRVQGHNGEVAALPKEAFAKYKSWRYSVAKSMIPFSAITAMLIDGVPCWEVDREYNRPPTTAAGWLIEALGYYR
jgi:hypothetical protein